MDRPLALSGEQTGIGEIQQRIGMNRLERDGSLKRVDGLGSIALFEVTFARVHHPGELVAAARCLQPQPDNKEERDQDEDREQNKIDRHPAPGTIGLNGFHVREGSADLGPRKAKLLGSHLNISQIERPRHFPEQFSFVRISAQPALIPSHGHRDARVFV